MKLKAIVRHVENLVGISGAPVTGLDCLIHYYSNVEGLLELPATERAEAELPVFMEKLSAHIDSIAQSSNLPVLCVLDEVSGRIAGSCWSSAGLTPDEIVRNRCVACITSVIDEIKSLSANEFEDFCAAFLSALGAAKTKVTPRSGDGEIDFYGWLNLGAFLPGDGGFTRLADRVRFYFAGQAKHYPDSRLGPAVVRELVGAVDLARYGIGSSGQDFFEGIKFKPLDPLVVLLITTGGFSKGARELASNSGIVPCDVGQVALYLAARRIGFVVGQDAVHFSGEMFRSWISKHANYELTELFE